MDLLWTSQKVTSWEPLHYREPNTFVCITALLHRCQHRRLLMLRESTARRAKPIHRNAPCRDPPLSSTKPCYIKFSKISVFPRTHKHTVLLHLLAFKHLYIGLGQGDLKSKELRLLVESSRTISRTSVDSAWIAGRVSGPGVGNGKWHSYLINQTVRWAVGQTVL